MTREQILANLQEIARTHFGVTDPLAPSTPLVAALDLDSLRRLTLIVEVEDRFRVFLEEGDDVGLETVGDMVALIAARMGGDMEARSC